MGDGLACPKGGNCDRPIVCGGVGGCARPDEKESVYLVYRWESDLAEERLVFHRREFIKHVIGQPITRAMVMNAIDTASDHYPAGQYSIVPEDRRYDFTVVNEVVWP